MRVEIKIDVTEALAILIQMRKDMDLLVDLVPDYVPELEGATERLSVGWARLAELVEAGTD